MTIYEFYSILLSEVPSEEIINNEDKVFTIIPELKKCKGFNQNNIWHPYDVYNHILHVVDKVDNDIVLRLAALFHDVGKPDTYSEDSDKVGHFYGHWDRSNEIFLLFAKNNNIDQEIVDKVTKLIYYHDLNISKLSDNGINKLLSNFNSEELKMLYKLKKADLLSQNDKFHDKIDMYEEEESKLLKRKNK